jgi:hypothetical protein
MATGNYGARSDMIENMDDVGLPNLSRTQINEILSAEDESRLDMALNRILAASQEGNCHGFNSHIAS